MKKKNSINSKDNSKIINISIIIIIVFLIGALILMFVKSDKGSNHIKEISYSEYQDVVKEDKYSIVLLTNPDCTHCNHYKPYVNYIAIEYDIDVYDINLTNVTYNEYVDLHDKFTATKDRYGENNMPSIPTPATIVMKNNKEVTSVLGDIGYDGLVKLLKNNNVIK